jgi:RNA polymerase sigma-70 factor (ECF subfamily)
MSELTNIAILVKRAQRGDRQAYAELAEQFRPAVYAMALARLRNPHEAEELTQDVLVHAFVKLGQLRHPAAFGGWLRRITARMAINRVARRGHCRYEDSALIDSAPAETATPLETVIDREEAARVREGMERLTPMDRDTLLAFYFRGQSLDEISREADAPIGTIKRRLHVARNRLRRELECAVS